MIDERIDPNVLKYIDDETLYTIIEREFFMEHTNETLKIIKKLSKKYHCDFHPYNYPLEIGYFSRLVSYYKPEYNKELYLPVLSDKKSDEIGYYLVVVIYILLLILVGVYL